MMCPRRLDEKLPTARTIEQAIDDLVLRLDELPSRHPDVPLIARQIEGLEFYLLGR